MLSYDELAAGITLLNRFRLVKELGEGGMGKVFKARDERLEEDVVIKVMKESLTGDPKTLEHFKREIRLARKISHPAVVRIFDFFEVGRLKFVTMECLQGTDLSYEIHKRGSFAPATALRIIAEFFEGLAAAHDLNVVHRDIKPHNVFLLAEGRVKILDFGIAQGLDPERPDHTMTQSIIGTPDYMSPEQLLGQKLDARTDIYSAGTMLYEMLTGMMPFEGNDMTERITSRLNRDPDPPSRRVPKIPGELDQFILRLIARHRDLKTLFHELAVACIPSSTPISLRSCCTIPTSPRWRLRASSRRSADTGTISARKRSGSNLPKNTGSRLMAIAPNVSPW